MSLWKSMPAERKVFAAKSQIMLSNPFFGTFAAYLQTVSTNDPSIETMATDGKKIYYCDKFVNSLSKPELVFVFAHEIMHCALKHMVRRGDRNASKWNVACDYAINGELVECKLGNMPKCGLIDPQYTGLSAEAIYNMLPDQPSGGDPGGLGAVIDAAASHDSAALSEAEAEIDSILQQAATVTKIDDSGKLPSSMKRLIENLLKPIVDWRAVLKRFIDENSSIKDYSWSNPNRRYLPLGYIFPGTISHGISHIVVAVDTSGSIDDQILTRFASEIQGAMDDGLIDKITIIYCDAEIHNNQVIERGDLIKMDPQGGGGTRFSPAFKWIADNTPDANAIIYMTDLYCSDFGEKPHCPVLWGVYGDEREFEQLSTSVPFGETLRVSE